MTPPEPSLIDHHGGLYVVDKPSGWVAHAAMPDEQHDVLAWALAAGLPKTLAPVNRLDRGTSGVLLYAETPELRGHFGALFAAGKVEKHYWALVHGRTHRKGTVKRPVKDGRAAKPAVTRWRRSEALGGFTLLSVHPETGRKHQIRQHLHGIGHAIVGDDRYRPKRFRKVPGYPGRLWLHASHLVLPGGRTYESPLPVELMLHLRVLRQGLAERA